MGDSSKITTDIAVDDAIQLDANYRLDRHDRRYMDNQILGCEEHLVDSLLSGYTATWGVLDGSSASVNIGDVLCAKHTGVTKATTADLANAGAACGVVVIPASPGTKVRFAIGGVLPAKYSKLGTGLAQPVRANPTTGALERVASYLTTDYPIGIADVDGNVTLDVGAVPASVTAGTMFVPSGTGFVHITGGVEDGAARAVNLSTVDVTGTLGIANGGTGLTSVGAANSVLTSTGSALTYSTSLSLVGLTLSGLAGGGTLMVTVDNSGVIGAQAIPSGGGGGTLAGDVVGAIGANLVTSISGASGSGAVAINGGVWTIAATTALGISQTTGAINVAANPINFTAQAANPSSSSNTNGAGFNFNLGSNSTALVTPWLNPTVPAFSVKYTDITLGSVGIFSIEPTRFFNAAGIGAGVYLSGANSWLDIGANPTTALGVISVDNGTDAIASTNHAITADMVLIGTDISDYVVIARTGTAGVKVAPLAGTGTRMVTTDASGILGSAALPSGVSVTGSGVWHSTSGTLDSAASIGTANQVFVTNSGATDTAWATVGGDVTGAISALVVGRLQGSIVLSGTPAVGNVLTATSTTAAHWAAPSGGTLPGGSSTQMQYNNAGAFGGTAEFTYASSKLNVSSAGAITFGTTPATTGYLRFANASTMISVWGGAANVVALASDASNFLYLGGTSSQTLEPTIVYLQATAAVRTVIGSTTILDVTPTTTTFSGSAFAFGAGVITQGSSPAGTGDLRVKNGWRMNGRNAALSADMTILDWDSSNQLSLGGTTVGGGQVSLVWLNAQSEVAVQIGAINQFAVLSGMVAVTSGQNFSIGNFAPAMNSATHTMYIKDGTQPTAAPATGVYLSSDSGSLHFRSSFSSGGVPVNIKFVEVVGGFGAIDPDHAIKIVIDKPGSATQTRYLRMYQ